MNDPLRAVSTRQTPQGQPAVGRKDQVENNAGGFVFATDPWQQLDRFLILGTWSNTFYSTQAELTLDNVTRLVDLVSEDANGVTDRVVEISTANRAPRNQPALFALAAVAAHADSAEARAYALEQLPRVARTATHLFTFINYVQQMRGWGRSLRRGIGNWYTSRTAESVAYQMVKYRQREGWTHRDVLRKAHPKPVDESMRTAFEFASNRVEERTGDERLAVIDAFLDAQQLSGDDVKRAVELVTEGGLPWEALPDALLDKPEVWEALLPNMGQTALIRQLPRLTRIGLLKPLSQTSVQIAEMIDNQERLIQGRIHPVNVLNALVTYASGRSARGTSTWQPVEPVVNALDSAFYKAFDAVNPAGVRTLNALDISGSMYWGTVAGSVLLTPAQAAGALSLVTLATEPLTHTVAFTSSRGGHWSRYGQGDVNPDDGISTLELSSRMRLDDVNRKMHELPMGGTDCALPMLWALKNNVEVDAFHIYTDNETWAGRVHPFEALRQYREKMGINAKVIVYGLTGTPFTIADPSDPGMMDVVGLDSSAPQLAADFAGGRL